MDKSKETIESVRLERDYWKGATEKLLAANAILCDRWVKTLDILSGSQGCACEFKIKKLIKPEFDPPHLTGIQLIIAERTKQEAAYDAAHDDSHNSGELITEAQCLIHRMQDDWGLVDKTSGDRVRQLVIAGALLAAEIDRLQRANPSTR